MIEPYVDEEVSWAVRVHQALRFFPDESVGYKYPDMYVKNFGPDYKPEPYIVREYEQARKHKWYMTARQICVNDIYSFDPNAKVDIDDFVDIVGRNFRQPEEGLGWDSSPSAHMWRTLMRPTRYPLGVATIAKQGPVDRSTGPFFFRCRRDQMRSGNRMMNLPAFGIFTFGSVCAFITSFSPISLLIASR